MPIICCSICMDAVLLFSSIELAAVPCGHVFHEKCLIDWLVTSPTCPKCRAPVVHGHQIIRLFMDIDLSSRYDGRFSDFLHEDFFAMVEATKELRVKLALQEKLTEAAVAKADKVEQALRTTTEESLEMRDEITFHDQIRVKLSSSLEKMKLKVAKDMILKKKLRTDNKELRQTVRDLKKKTSELSVELAAVGHKALEFERIHSGLKIIRKDFNKLFSSLHYYGKDSAIQAKVGFLSQPSRPPVDKTLKRKILVTGVASSKR